MTLTRQIQIAVAKADLVLCWIGQLLPAIAAGPLVLLIVLICVQRHRRRHKKVRR